MYTQHEQREIEREQEHEAMKAELYELRKDLNALTQGFFAQNKRLDLIESVFKKLAEFDMRLDTLEFNSNAPVKPGISEKLATLEYRLDHIHDFLTQGEIVNE
jgi:hypothetical protein